MQTQSEAPSGLTLGKRLGLVGSPQPPTPETAPALTRRARRAGRCALELAKFPAAGTALARIRSSLPQPPSFLDHHALKAKVPVTSRRRCACAVAPGSRPPTTIWRRTRVGSAVAQLSSRPFYPAAPRRLLTPRVMSPRRWPPLQRAELRH